MSDRLDQQMAFLAEADRLKGIERATRVLGGARFENSAEHSWHLALYALTLGDHAPAGVDRDRVIRMLLLHDLVEIDAGVPMSVSSLRPVPPGPSKGMRKSFIPLPPWHWHGNRRENA